MRPLPIIKPTIWPTLNLSNFYGGLNKRDASSEIADNEVQDLLNVNFADSGGVSKRKGTNIVGDDKGANIVRGLYAAYYGGSSAKMLMANQDASTSGLWYRTTGNYTEAGLDAGGSKLANADTEFENFLDVGGSQRIFVADNTRYQKWSPADNKIYACAASPATISSIIRVYKNRMYARGTGTRADRIYFSALGNGESWGASDYFDVPSQSPGEAGSTGDSIRALAVLQDRLIILKTRSIWTWDGTRLRKLSDAHGALSRRAWAANDNYLYFADNDGVYALSGTSIRKISKKIQPVWDLIPATTLGGVTLGLFKGKLYVATATTGATINNIILVNYTELPQDDEGQQSWSYWKGTTANPLSANSFITYESSSSAAEIFVYGCANTQGATVQLETGNADYDFAGPAQNESIDGYYKTKDYPLSARFKKLFLSLKSRASSYDLNVTATIDYKTARSLTYDMYDAAYASLTKGANVAYNGKYINYKFETSACSARPFMVYDGKQTFKPLRLRK